MVALVRLLRALVRPSRFAPFLLVLAGAIAYLHAGQELPTGDEGALLVHAAKLLHGGVFYRDVDAYYGPLSPYLLSFAMGLFGEHLSVARGAGLERVYRKRTPGCELQRFELQPAPP